MLLSGPTSSSRCRSGKTSSNRGKSNPSSSGRCSWAARRHRIGARSARRHRIRAGAAHPRWGLAPGRTDIIESVTIWHDVIESGPEQPVVIGVVLPGGPSPSNWGWSSTSSSGHFSPAVGCLRIRPGTAHHRRNEAGAARPRRGGAPGRPDVVESVPKRHDVVKSGPEQPVIVRTVLLGGPASAYLCRSSTKSMKRGQNSTSSSGQAKIKHHSVPCGVHCLRVAIIEAAA